MADKDIILEVRDLKKYFKSPTGTLHAVDGVNFSIRRGETLGLVGESGCGKSTIGRLILGLHQSTSGEILFNGQDICKMNKKQLHDLRKDLQIIFQDPFSSLNPRMSIGEIIGEPLRIHAKAQSRAELDKEVSRLMDVVGLSARLFNAYPHELDGGRRQRIGIARALILNPEFVVCDEPVSALDVSIQAQILNLLMDLQESMNLTYMFITHDLSVVRHISNEIMVMYLGKCVERAEAKEIFRNPVHPYTKALLAAIPIPSIESCHKKRELLQGEVTSPVNPKPGCRFAARCKYATELCRSETPKLEEMEEGHYVACHRVKEI